MPGRRSKGAACAVGPASDRVVEHVEGLLGHEFSDRTLIRTAITHPVAVEGMSALLAYERLELLGDAVITFIVTDELYRRFPESPEGELTRIKTAVVRGGTFTDAASRLGLDIALEGLNLSTRGRESALENIFESVTGALYLDAGIDATRSFVLRLLGDMLTPEAQIPVHPKTRFLELMAAQGRQTSFELVAETGPSHDRVFTAHALVDGEVVGRGTGSSKKDAETAACTAALEAIDGDPERFA